MIPLIIRCRIRLSSQVRQSQAPRRYHYYHCWYPFVRQMLMLPRISPRCPSRSTYICSLLILPPPWPAAVHIPRPPGLRSTLPFAERNCYIVKCAPVCPSTGWLHNQVRRAPVSRYHTIPYHHEYVSRGPIDFTCVRT